MNLRILRFFLNIQVLRFRLLLFHQFIIYSYKYYSLETNNDFNKHFKNNKIYFSSPPPSSSFPNICWIFYIYTLPFWTILQVMLNPPVIWFAIPPRPNICNFSASLFTIGATVLITHPAPINPFINCC
ncbi:MAG: hypothetical protein Ta2E_01940 [Mycoplasmoidaceae bacterium]|nr:MAG: hypothetical protein Ta2E_01940 [Mycoplasmoidaceae bacterium]